MVDFSQLIENKKASAQYMIDEISHICTTMPKRAPGSEGEKIACEYMAEVLKTDCGCDKSQVEPFKLQPNSFYGWIYFTVTLALINIGLYFFIPAIGVALMVFGLIIMVIQFGLYKKAIDFLFPQKTGHNVTAIKSCSDTVKARIFFNGHPDAAWNWPVSEKLGGIVYELHILISLIGTLFCLTISIIATVKIGFTATIITPQSNPVLFYLGIASLAFVPFLVGMYFLWDEKTTVDGANDNLSGCYMGIAILKALKDANIDLQHTEVGVILSGAEEAGLRGAKAWTKKYKDKFNDVPTWIISFDTIRESQFLMVNYRDMHALVKSDKEVGDLFYQSAVELGIKCNKGMVPPFGGSTDAAAFAQGGFKSVGITALNHVLQDYYHTPKDTPDNMDKDCLADCFAVSIRCLEKFDAMHR